MYDFLSIGEMLIDFIPVPSESGTVYQQNPGGSPANLACALAKLGVKTGFIGKVGNDPFGHSCKAALEKSGVDISNLILSDEYQTPLAFIRREEDGKHFTFYRNETTADQNLTAEDINPEIFRDLKVFHFSSFSLTAEPSRSTILNAAAMARECGALITFDPNIRLNMWSSPEEAKAVILNCLPLVDILKLSIEDMEFLLPGMDERELSQQLYQLYGTQMIIISRSAQGCYAYVNEDHYVSCAYETPVVDTTGAGDAFFAGIIFNLLTLHKNIFDLSSVEITVMLDLANALGSLAVTKPGAIDAFPTRREVVLCMENTPKIYPVSQENFWNDEDDA